MSKEILSQLGGKIELKLLENGIVEATLVGGSRPLQGHGSTTESALSSMVKESLVHIDEPQTRVWALSVIASPDSMPSCVVLYCLEEGARLYYTRDRNDNSLVSAQMSPEDVDAAVEAVRQVIEDGDIVITYDGLKRDFKILAELANRPKLSKLAMHVFDIAFQMVSMRGFSIPFATATAGMHVEYSVTRQASWDYSPKDAVDAATDYCTALIILWENTVFNGKALEWTAKSGRASKLEFGRMLDVKACLELPEPDTSWMTTPAPKRTESLKWMRQE